MSNNNKQEAIDKRNSLDYLSIMRSARGDIRRPPTGVPPPTVTTGMFQNARNFARQKASTLPSYEEGDFGRGEADVLRKKILERYSDPTRGLSAGAQPNSFGWFDLPNSGSGMAVESRSGASYLDDWSPGGGADFSSPKRGYQDMADTGGARDFEEALEGYRDFARGGGVDARALRQRATAQIPAFYNQFKQAAQRRSNVQGGYSPGFDAQQAEMARQAGREGFNASRQVEGDIADKIQQGKMFGVSGMGNVAGQISGNRLAGLGGLTNIAGTEGQLSLARSAQGLQRAGLEADIDFRNRDFAEGSRRFDTGTQMDLQRMWQQGDQFGTAGMADMYRSAPGTVGQNYNAFLGGLGGRSGVGAQKDNRGFMDKWGKYITGGIGAVGGAIIGGPAGAYAGWNVGSGVGGAFPSRSGSDFSQYDYYDPSEYYMP